MLRPARTELADGQPDHSLRVVALTPRGTAPPAVPLGMRGPKGDARWATDAEDMSATHAASAPRGARATVAGPHRTVVALALLLIVATVYGGWRVATAPAAQPGVDAPPSLLVGHTRFTITHVERVDGLTNADLSGMAHGIQGLVLDDSTLIRVSMTVSAGDEATAFDAGRLRLLRGAGGASQEPLGGSIGRGTLRPHASVEGAVSFVVPRDGARLLLGAVGTGTRLSLLKIDDAPPGAGHMDMHLPGPGDPGPPAHQHTEKK